MTSRSNGGNVGDGAGIEGNSTQGLSLLFTVFGVFIRDSIVWDSVCLQLFLLFVGIMSILCGCYVISMLFTITYHNYYKDPSSYVIPEFISSAYQFSTDEESFDDLELEMLARYEDFLHRGYFRDGEFYLPAKKVARTVFPV